MLLLEPAPEPTPAQNQQLQERGQTDVSAFRTDIGLDSQTSHHEQGGTVAFNTHTRALAHIVVTKYIKSMVLHFSIDFVCGTLL